MSSNRRILLIDDSESIHQDFAKILGTDSASSTEEDQALADFFDDDDDDDDDALPVDRERPVYELSSALQGKEGFELAKAACERGEPFALAFVDVRMPPGWDGVETIEAIWKVDRHIQVVMCTAFSDYSWTETIQRLGYSDRLLILKKPFDPVEICQAASALTEKWNVRERERALLDEVRKAEQEARAYASSLETVNRALETAKAGADKALEAKTEFLARMTSSVNEVLGQIFGRIGGLRDLAASPEELVSLESTIDASARLMTLLTQVSDLTQLEAAHMEIKRSSSDPVVTVDRVLAELAPVAAAKGLSLAYETTAPIPTSIQTDADRSADVLRHLVQNAIEHTASGSVRVFLGVESTDNWRHPRLVYNVVDTGSGVPPQHQGNLFEPFYRVAGVAKGAEDALSAHTGLGLTIARRLAHFLQGDVTVESVPGKGSTFCFSLETGNLMGVEMVEGVSKVFDADTASAGA